MKNTIFYLGFGTLMTHELDAIANHEWRVLPLLNSLPDQLAMDIFIIGHIPLTAILVALIASSNTTTRLRTCVGLSAVLVVHAIAHGLSMNQPDYEFESLLSNFLIFGGGMFGGLYLVLELKNGFARLR